MVERALLIAIGMPCVQVFRCYQCTSVKVHARMPKYMRRMLFFKSRHMLSLNLAEDGKLRVYVSQADVSSLLAGLMSF